MIDLILRKAKIDGVETLLDIAIDGGVIIERSFHITHCARQEIDVGGRLVIPGFVDGHLHLDIALMNSWQRPGRTEPFGPGGTGMEEDMLRRRRQFTREDIEQRAGMALALASRHGVTAVRAQCHVDTEIGLKNLEALLSVKRKYAGRVTVQIVAYPQAGLLQDPATIDLFREAFRAGADVMGCQGVGLDVRRDALDAAFDLAMEHNVDLDVHADLRLPQTIHYNDLDLVYIARKAIEVGYHGRVTAGHACALDSLLPDDARRVIELIKKADISIISMPDLYRLGREDTHHVRRGLTRVKELLQAGVNVAYASNNVRDALRPLGNLDPLEEALILAYGRHMDSVDELDMLVRMGTVNGARAIRLDKYGLEEGCWADLVVLDAPSASAAVVGQVEKRFVFKEGRLMAANKLISETYNGVLDY